MIEISIIVQQILFFPLLLLMNNRKTKILLTCATLETRSQGIKIYTKFYKPIEPDRVKYDDEIAQLYVYTQYKSYFSKLKRKNINNELTWNMELLNRLENILAGKNSHIVVNLSNGMYDEKILNVATQIDLRQIRIGLFEVVLNDINEKPLISMRNLMEQMHINKSKTLEQYEKRQQDEMEYLNKIDLIKNELTQSHKDEMNLIKQNFLPLINQAKRKLKKCFNSSSINDEEYKSVTSHERVIYRIKDKSSPQKENKQEKLDVQFIDLLE